MKKILLLACAGVLCFSQVNAANCEAGTEITGRNGHVYCKSNNPLNWWTAGTWCEAQGRHLASMEEMCPDTGEGLNNAWDGSTGEGKCANLIISETDAVWSSLAYGTSKAFTVGIGPGRVENNTARNYYTRWNAYDAFCY